MNTSYLHFTISSDTSGMTIDQYLRKEAGLTPHQIKTLKYRDQGIQVNGLRQRVTYRLCTGDIISIQTIDAHTASDHLLPVKGIFSILYEDSDLIVVSKPSGVVVHPSGAHYSDTLANHLAYYFQEKKEAVTLSAIGRLDKDTSGLVLFAKHTIAASILNKQRETGVLQKTYLALTQGKTSENGTCESPLRQKEDNPYVMEVHADGLPALTYFHRLAYGNDSSLLQLTLKTGRMHQIRIHMASLHHPLLGDPIYHSAPEHMVFSRAALHAVQLSFLQPLSRKEIIVKAPLPEDFIYYIKNYMPDILPKISV